VETVRNKYLVTVHRYYIFIVKGTENYFLIPL